MGPAEATPRLRIADSITKLTDDDRGAILVAGSHGGVYAAYLAAAGGVRAVVLNDAGIGLDRAGIGGLLYLDEIGLPAATVGHLSARIGDGADMMSRGRISHANAAAIGLGVEPGQDCADCVRLLAKAGDPAGTPRPYEEARFLLLAKPGCPVVSGLDSNALVRPEDAGTIVVTGSHGGLLGGRPETAIRVDALAAIYNDAGIGIDRAGLSRLPALEARGIAGATVDVATARIGDARSTWETGIVSAVNALAAQSGGQVGMTTRALVDCLLNSPLARKPR